MAWNLTSQARTQTGQQFWRELAFGPHGTYSSEWARYLDRDPMMQNVVMVVELVMGGGQRFFLSTQPSVVERAIAGVPQSARQRGYMGQLIEEPQITTEYSIGDGAASQRSVAFKMGLPGFDPWLIIRRQQRILAGFGQVSLIAPGMAWRDRFVMLTGDMVGGISFGGPNEALSFKLQDPTISVDLGVTEYVADADRFPNIPDDYVGQRFPLAINSPRSVSCVRTDGTTTPTFLVCVGHDYDVTDVYVDGDPYVSASTVFPWAVVYASDARGVPYTGVEFSAGTGTWEDTTSVHATLQPRAPKRTNKNVVDTIRELVESWSLIGPATLNDEAFTRAQGVVRTQAAPGVFINGSSDQDATRSLEYIEATICRELPMVSMAWQPGGYGPVVTDRKAPAVAKWVVGQGPLFDRASEWTESDKAGVFNWWSLRYDYNAASDSFDKVVLRNPNNNLLCQISEEQSGPLDSDPRESVIIRDAALATWVVDWLVEHFALPWYTADYVAEPSVLIKYRIGQNIDLVDREIYGTTFDTPLRATITAITYARGQCIVRLAIWVLYTQFSGGVSSGESTPSNTTPPGQGQ